MSRCYNMCHAAIPAGYLALDAFGERGKQHGVVRFEYHSKASAMGKLTRAIAA